MINSPVQTLNWSLFSSIICSQLASPSSSLAVPTPHLQNTCISLWVHSQSFFLKLEGQIPNGELIITPVLAENESEMMEASPSNQPTVTVKIQLAVSARKFTLASLGEGMQRDCPGYYSIWNKQSPDFSLPPLQPMPALTLSGNIKLQDS